MKQNKIYKTSLISISIITVLVFGAYLITGLQASAHNNEKQNISKEDFLAMHSKMYDVMEEYGINPSEMMQSMMKGTVNREEMQKMMNMNYNNEINEKENFDIEDLKVNDGFMKKILNTEESIMGGMMK